MNISSLPFYRSSQTVSRTSEPSHLPHDHARTSSSREQKSWQLISQLAGDSRSQSSRNELPRINTKRTTDWSWLDLPSTLPPPSSLRKRTGLGSRGSVRKQPYKMRESDISEHIAMLKRKHLALERDQTQPSYEILSNCEEAALQEVPASPQQLSVPPSVMGLTVTSDLHDSVMGMTATSDPLFFSDLAEEQPPLKDIIPLSATHTDAVHQQSLPEEDIAYGFGLDNYSDIFEHNHEDYYDPSSALTEEGEQAWLFPAGTGDELPLPLSLESNDTDYEFSELSHQRPDVNIPLLAHQQTPSPEPSPRYLQPLSQSPPTSCSFDPSTFSIQNYYPREE